MKVKLQCGDTIAIPDGCKATIKDGSVVFEKEVQEFKDGDVLRSFYNDTMLIFKDINIFDRDYFDSHYNNKGFGEKRWYKESFCLATEKEKKLLFNKMKEQGLKWNAEEKKVEKIRWRAPEKCKYWYCTIDFNAVKTADCRYELDHRMHSYGNYFRTEEQAEEAAKRMKETLRKYHEEIGE